LRLFPFGGYGLALAALALVVFGAIECPPNRDSPHELNILLNPIMVATDTVSSVWIDANYEQLL